MLLYETVTFCWHRVFSFIGSLKGELGGGHCIAVLPFQPFPIDYFSNLKLHNFIGFLASQILNTLYYIFSICFTWFLLLTWFQVDEIEGVLYQGDC